MVFFEKKVPLLKTSVFWMMFIVHRLLDLTLNTVINANFKYKLIAFTFMDLFHMN